MNFNEPSEFIGYDHLSCDGKIIALFNVEGKMVDSLEDEGMIILDKTCFYAESGGQVADKGTFSADGVEVEVLDVQKTRNKQHIHTVKINGGVLEKGMALHGEVNVKDRLATTANHSCTHLLQSALVKVLGIIFTKLVLTIVLNICVLTLIIMKRLQLNNWLKWNVL